MDNRIEIISKNQAKRLNRFAFKRKNVLQPSRINVTSKQHKVSMILARMISEDDVCGSVFLEDFDGNNILRISTNDKSNLEIVANTILNEIRTFIQLRENGDDFNFIEIYRARNKIIKRSILRFLKSSSLNQAINNLKNNANEIFSLNLKNIIAYREDSYYLVILLRLTI